MKKLLIFLLILSLTSCAEDGENDDCSIVGRWILEGFEDNVMYEFTDDLRYTIYAAEPGMFGTIEDAIPGPNDYMINQDSITIDLDFGNFSTNKVEFKCDCQVLDLVNTSGTTTLFTEGHNLSSCD